MTEKPSTFADRVAALTRQLAAQDSPLALGLWERGTAVRIGRVTQGIKGVSRNVRCIEDGYQYVGGFPAHMWRAAASDETYRTLHFGIRTFGRRWGNGIKQEITHPMHYVSIGPGTGEKDATILKHLESLATGPIVYIPVDISADLLRMSLELSVEDTNDDFVDVLPIELDITSDRGLDGLRQVITQMTTGPVLISLLGNTLGNFRDDSAMLSRIATLLSSKDDRLLLELATTEHATEELAAVAGAEYAGSVSFRNFVLAALAQYTNVTPDSGLVSHAGKVADDKIEVGTYFATDEPLDVYVNDSDRFVLAPGEAIELYRSRKYTETALSALLTMFDEVDRRRTAMPPHFGLATYLLRLNDGAPSADEKGWAHYAARPPT